MYFRTANLGLISAWSNPLAGSRVVSPRLRTGRSEVHPLS